MTAVAAPPTTAPERGSSAWQGTGRLAWLIWRRDRLRLSAWVVVIALLPISLAQATATAYPTDAIRVAFANAAAANPAELALRARCSPRPSAGYWPGRSARPGCW